jgi:hypothetical protein
MPDTDRRGSQKQRSQERLDARISEAFRCDPVDGHRFYEARLSIGQGIGLAKL